MKRFAVPLFATLALSACAYFQSNPDAGQPAVERTTARSVHDVIECLTAVASQHGEAFRTSALPQGTMVDFGDSNVVKIRSDNGKTDWRFYAGKRHASNLWIENAGAVCAP